MRNLLAALCLILSGVLAIGAMWGHQIDQLLRDDEPLREIAGDLPHDEQFGEAVTQMMVSELTDQMPEQASNFIGGGVEDFVSGAVEDLLDDERMHQAWEETLQTTRADYVERLEALFEEGSSGDTSELDIRVDLEPLAGAAINSIVDSIPMVDADSFDIPTPQVEVDIAAAATDSDADPYTWATAVVVAQYWVWVGVASGVMLLLGLALGQGRGRGVALALGGISAALGGLWVALNVAAPDFDMPAELPQENVAILDFVQTQFTDWAQPVWWFFVAGAVGVVVLGILGALVARPVQRR